MSPRPLKNLLTPHSLKRFRSLGAMVQHIYATKLLVSVS